MSDEGFAYFLVGALCLPGFPLLIDVRPLTSRTSAEVCDELGRKVVYFRSLDIGMSSSHTPGPLLEDFFLGTISMTRSHTYSALLRVLTLTLVFTKQVCQSDYHLAST